MKRHLKNIVIVILLTGLAFLSVQGFYRYLEQKLAFVRVFAKQVNIPPSAPLPRMIFLPSSPSNTPADKPDPPSTDQSAIAIRDKMQDIQELEQMLLNLKLMGTLLRDKAHAQAVIKDLKSGVERIYRIGDKVGRATIKRIDWEKIVLTLNGQEAVLGMQESQNIGPLAGSIAPGATQTAAGPLKNQTILLKPSTIDDVIKNLSQLQQQVSLQPYMENGKPSGVKLSGAPVNSVMEEAGIRSGDIIKSVNGQEIRTINDALRIYEKLKASGAKFAAVQIIRNGRSITIYYRVP